MRRRHRGVLGLEARVGRRDLLPQRVVRHQRLDQDRQRQADGGELVQAVHEFAAADVAVDIQVIKLHRLARDRGRLGLFHCGNSSIRWWRTRMM
jgi:hypothetical protein